jgi:hypothetical protein
LYQAFKQTAGSGLLSLLNSQAISHSMPSSKVLGASTAKPAHCDSLSALMLKHSTSLMHSEAHDQFLTKYTERAGINQENAPILVLERPRAFIEFYQLK